MIEPLASQLVFPMPQISHPTQLSHGISASSGDQLKEIELLAMESSGVVFKLDAVLLDNGVVLGPDTTQFADAYRSAFAGEQDIVRFIVTSAAAGVPDTFTYHLKLSSSGPMSVSILSIHQFGDAVRCVETGRGSTNYCMHHSGSANGWLNTTSVNYDFHLAEGCAAYMTVITAAGNVTVTPDVSVTYNPATSATGACA